MPNDNPNHNRGQLPILQPPEHPNRSPDQKSGRGRIRAVVLILVHVLIAAHLAHFWTYGRSLSPVEPSEAMYAIELGYINAGTIFFGIAILSTAIFGRFFCGWGCHIVALQDLSGYLLRRLGLRPKPLRSRLLVLVPFALAFYMFFWPTVKRLWQQQPHPGFTNHLMTEDFWKTFTGGPVVDMFTFFVCGGLIVYLLGNKGFCTYACPYGAFFSISDRLAVGRIRVTDACHQCGKCTANCTSNVSVMAEVRDFGMVVDPGCMKCMDCVSVCPNDALYYGFSQQNPVAMLSDTAADSSKPVRPRKTYDFSLAEELTGLVVAALVVFALRGLYDITPLLLSVALGVITAWLAIQFWRIFRKRDLRIQHFQIKRNGRTTAIGRWAMVAMGIWFAFNIQSFIVQYHRYRGRGHLARVNVVWDEMLGGQFAERLTTADRANIETAVSSFGITDRIGLANVLEVKLGLAVANRLNGDVQATEKYLRQAFEFQPAAVREMLMEFLVSQGRQQEAAELL